MKLARPENYLGYHGAPMYQSGFVEELCNFIWNMGINIISLRI
jgi:hypothetical protein